MSGLDGQWDFVALNHNLFPSLTCQMPSWMTQQKPEANELWICLRHTNLNKVLAFPCQNHSPGLACLSGEVLYLHHTSLVQYKKKAWFGASVRVCVCVRAYTVCAAHPRPAGQRWVPLIIWTPSTPDFRDELRINAPAFQMAKITVNGIGLPPFAREGWKQLPIIGWHKYEKL